MMMGYPGPHGGGMGMGPMGAIAWDRLQRFMMEGLPVAAVAHSIHVDALADPKVREDAGFQRFSAIELNELHHQIAALGALMRLQMGDRGALSSLGTNLAGFIQNRRSALKVAKEFSPAVLANPSVQAMMRLVQQSNQQISANWPVLQQTLDALDAEAPGPMLVQGTH